MDYPDLLDAIHRISVVADAVNAYIAARDAARTGDTYGAIEEYSKTLAGDPHNAPVLLNRALALLKTEEASLALAALADAEHVVELRPEWYKGWAVKGAALLALGRGTDAVQAYNAAMVREPMRQDLVQGLRKANLMASDLRSNSSSNGDLESRRNHESMSSTVTTHRGNASSIFANLAASSSTPRG
eukprot:SAG31_NODE_3145_length_4621_cov_2.448695_3_plen_187_part_00